MYACTVDMITMSIGTQTIAPNTLNFVWDYEDLIIATPIDHFRLFTYMYHENKHAHLSCCNNNNP